VPEHDLANVTARLCVGRVGLLAPQTFSSFTLPGASDGDGGYLLHREGRAEPSLRTPLVHLRLHDQGPRSQVR
jgi:hypothetical protein